MWQYRETTPARGVISRPARAQTVIKVCVWASNLTTLLSRWGMMPIERARWCVVASSTHSTHHPS